jgi:hypothetical protein
LILYILHNFRSVFPGKSFYRKDMTADIDYAIMSFFAKIMWCSRARVCKIELWIDLDYLIFQYEFVCF